MTIPHEPMVLYKSKAAYMRVMRNYDATVARWPIQPESQMVPTRYGATHVLVAGPPGAPALLLFHGWGGNASGHGIDPGFAPLLTRFRTYMPDVVGQTGKSAPTRPPTQGGAYGAWAVDLLDGLKLDRAYATGISGGGFMTLQAASAAPERITRAVAVSTAGVAPLRFSSSLRMLLTVVPLLLAPSEATAQRFIRGLVPPMVELTPMHRAMVGDIHLIMATLRRPAVGITPLTDEELRRIAAPTKVLMGQYERTTDPQAVIRRARALIPRVETELVPNVGHVMSFDAPELVTRRILDFFHAW